MSDIVPILLSGTGGGQGGGGTPSTLLNGLVSYYKLDESAGSSSWVDQLVYANLTASGTVGSAAGIQGTAAVTTSGFLQAASGKLDFKSTDNFTIAVWVYPTSIVGSSQVISKNLAYRLAMKFDGSTWNFSNAFNTPVSAGTPTANAWQLIVVWQDVTAGTFNISVNNGTPVSATHAVLNEAADVFNFGNRAEADLPLIGRLDETGIWSRVLTAGERTILYNSGLGVTYPGFG